MGGSAEEFDLRKGLDPQSRGGGEIEVERASAREAPDPTPLSGECIRRAYEAVAAAGTEVTGQDAQTLRSLRDGAAAAAEAAGTAERIGGGPGIVLRQAARAWYPYAVDDQAPVWKTFLRAFSQTCDAAQQSDQQVVVDAVAAARASVADDTHRTAAAVRVFGDELAARSDDGQPLAPAWSAATRRVEFEAPDEVFLVVVRAVDDVIRQGL